MLKKALRPILIKSFSVTDLIMLYTINALFFVYAPWYRAVLGIGLMIAWFWFSEDIYLWVSGGCKCECHKLYRDIS